MTDPAAARLLVVDDDDDLRRDIVGKLAELGYSVCDAADVATARRVLSEGPADLCLVDIMMPGTSGKVLCREITEGSDSAVVMISSLGDVETIAALLELGADDYIVKPFEMVELAARVRAVLRRRQRAVGGAPAARPRFGPWTLDPVDRRLSHETGRTVALTPGEMGVLRFLGANPGVIFSREDLLAISRTRQHGGTSDRSIDNLVKRLRRKIEETPDQPRLIVTEWGKGYRFEPGG